MAKFAVLDEEKNDDANEEEKDVAAESRWLVVLFVEEEKAEVFCWARYSLVIS